MRPAPITASAGRKLNPCLMCAAEPSPYKRIENGHVIPFKPEAPGTYPEG